MKEKMKFRSFNSDIDRDEVLEEIDRQFKGVNLDTVLNGLGGVVEITPTNEKYAEPSNGIVMAFVDKVATTLVLDFYDVKTDYVNKIVDALPDDFTLVSKRKF